MAVTRQSWAHSLLSALDVPVSTQNLKCIVAWEVGEGGAGPQFGVANNQASYNPLNTTQPEPGASNTGVQGNIKAYISWRQGLEATVATLNSGHYGAILTLLQGGSSTSQAFASAVNSSVWGTHDLTAELIDGAQLSGGTGGEIVNTTIGGGVFGLGGTGTPANNANVSLWYVGDSSNPDQDYWTTINQYGQDAQWYVFSDGENLIVADGTQLMGQTPAALIIRTDPAVLSYNMTYDNTAFNFTHTHTVKGKIQRRATLAKIMSPTQVELKVVCDIDKFRGGDVVYLKLWGPADGLWLIGECDRSVFQPYSTLTLVQAMQPINANSGLALGPAFTTGKEASRPGSGTVIAAMVSEAATINSKNFPYEYGGGHAHAGTPDTGDPGGNHEAGNAGVGFDCSGAVGAVLAAGGLWKLGSSVPASNGIVDQLKQDHLVLPGSGAGTPECTLYDTPGHIFMRLNGQIFGTADGSGHLPSTPLGGVGWIPNGVPGSAVGFRTTHVPMSILGQAAAAVTGAA